MKCLNCGAETQGDAKFCARCDSNPALGGAGEPPVINSRSGQIPLEEIVGYSIRTGWKLVRKNLRVVLSLVVVMAAISAVLNGAQLYFQSRNTTIWAVFYVVALLVGPAIGAGGFFQCLLIVRGERGDVAGIFKGFGENYLALLAASLLQMIATVAGVMLCIVPGIFVFLGFSQILFLIMDRRLSGVEALKESWRLMKGHKGEYFVLWIALAGINILGLLCLVVGVFVTISISLMASAAFYQRLVELERLNNATVAAPPPAPQTVSGQPF
ncbi:MAG: hypothetical protein WC889_09230 [Myxococcota bacterium]|jgi:uncharacterized membrane protein